MTIRCGKDNFSWYAQTFNVLMCLFFVNIISFNALWKFLRLGNWDGIFSGLMFGLGIFLGLLEALRRFFGF